MAFPGLRSILRFRSVFLMFCLDRCAHCVNFFALESGIVAARQARRLDNCTSLASHAVQPRARTHTRRSGVTRDTPSPRSALSVNTSTQASDGLCRRSNATSHGMFSKLNAPSPSGNSTLSPGRSTRGGGNCGRVAIEHLLHLLGVEFVHVLRIPLIQTQVTASDRHDRDRVVRHRADRANPFLHDLPVGSNYSIMPIRSPEVTSGTLITPREM